MGYPAVWTVRASVLPNKMLPTSWCSWSASRPGSAHGTGAGTPSTWSQMTPRPRWMGQLAAWAATTIWAIVAFLAGTAVLYGVTATRATWGGPPWWPVVASCAELALLAALGFTAGALFPGRFTAPLAAVGAFVLSLEGFNNAVGRSSAFAVLSPTTYVPANDAGVFYPYPPDVAIDQLMFLAGLTVVVLGVLGLVRSSGAGPGLRRGVAVLTAAGAAAALTAVGLAGTARQQVPGTTRTASATAPLGRQSPWIIPALHDAASDRPVPYPPVCVTAILPVCIHPAFKDFLPDVTAGLGPVLRELAGLPGAPVRVAQAPVGLATPSGAVIGVGTAEGALDGTPPVFRYTADTLPARVVRADAGHLPPGLARCSGRRLPAHPGVRQRRAARDYARWAWRGGEAGGAIGAAAGGRGTAEGAVRRARPALRAAVARAAGAGQRGGAAAGRAARRGPARLARRPPARAAGRPRHARRSCHDGHRPAHPGAGRLRGPGRSRAALARARG